MSMLRCLFFRQEFKSIPANVPGKSGEFCVETVSGLELRRIRVSIHYNCLLSKLNQSHCFKQGFQLNAIVPISASDKSKHGLQII